jgi:uncharacterized protein (TIGR03084 family)
MSEIRAADSLLTGILADLADEGQLLEEVLCGLTDNQWHLPTPSSGWNVGNQVAHLAWTDSKLLLALRQPERFALEKRAIASNPSIVDESAVEGFRSGPAGTLERWQVLRREVLSSLASAPGDIRVPWFGPPMGAATAATSRLMETWAHGHDIAEALGVYSRPSERIRHVIQLAIMSRDFSFTNNGLTPPREKFRLTLVAPNGIDWTWGPVDAAQRVEGIAVDFALLATRRRTRDDCAVTAYGGDAERWLDVIQAFAGPPGPPPAKLEKPTIGVERSLDASQSGDGECAS